MADGLQVVWQVPILRAVLIMAPLVNFAFNGVTFTITLALRQHGTSTAVIGLVQAGIAVGGLLGAVIAPRLQRRARLGTLATAITLAGALLFVAAALLIPSPLVAAPVALDLVLAPTVNAALFAVMLRGAPEEMRGRITNTVFMVATALSTLAPLVAGLARRAPGRRLGGRRVRRDDGRGGGAVPDPAGSAAGGVRDDAIPRVTAGANEFLAAFSGHGCHNRVSIRSRGLGGG